MARAASLAVRQAKAAARKGGAKSTDGTDQTDENLDWFDQEGIVAMTDDAIATLNKKLRAKEKSGKVLDDLEKAFLGEVSKELARRAKDTVRKRKKATSGVVERAGGGGYFDEKTGQYRLPGKWRRKGRTSPVPPGSKDL